MNDFAAISPFVIPVAGIIFGTVMIIVVVGITFWSKAREKELQVHQECAYGKWSTR